MSRKDPQRRRRVSRGRASREELGNRESPGADLPRQGNALHLVVAMLLPIVVVLHIVGAGPLRNAAWGVHHYGFHAAWVLPVACLLLALSVAFSRTASWSSILGRLPDPARWPSRQRVATLVVLAALAAGVFWVARTRNTLLGDGNVITATLSDSGPFHVREPLTALLNFGLYRVMSWWLDPSTPKHEVAHLAVASGSIVAGVLFVVAAFAIALELSRLAKPAPDFGGPRETSPSGSIPWLLCGVLAAQGYVQLFYGYVENYSFYTAMLTVYVWLSLRFLARRTTFAFPAMAAVCCIGLHLSGGVVLPSLLILAGIGIAAAETRRRTLRDLVLIFLLCSAMGFSLSLLGDGYNVVTFFVDLARRTVVVGARDVGYMWSQVHWRDFSNEQLLIGPMGILLFGGAVVTMIVRRQHRTPVSLFLLSLSLVYIGAVWVTKDTNLGYARDWDLFAPGGVLLTSSGLGLLLQGHSVTRTTQRALFCALVLSCFHAAPWIALNASELKAVERMKILPLGGGRSQMVVGNWYLRRGETDTALVWLERSHTEFPLNISTNYLLGITYATLDEYERAIPMLSRAVEMRPGNPRYRRELIDTMVKAGRNADAISHVRYLADRDQLTDADRRRYRKLLTRVHESTR